MDFTMDVTNIHGPSHQPIACRSPTCSQTTATVNNQAKARFKPTLPEKSGVFWVAIRCQHILVSGFTCTPHGERKEC